MNHNRIAHARITPEGSLEVLSQLEVNRLRDTSLGGLHPLLRQCALAVLNTGSHVDNSRQVMEEYQDFDIQIVQQERGIKLELFNAPMSAFVDGEMIRGIKEHLFAVLRDLVYVNNEIAHSERFDLHSSSGITNAIFHILRNARALRPHQPPDLVVCWGGHSISREEYDYTKEVGHQLGLRDLDICTGCGPGAMKGPMKGATIGHAKQRERGGRYIGITEPGIIAAEPPNPIVSNLVIMPDIEKRLEAFVRLGHGFIVFPGGVGTTEEILYLLGILLHPTNAALPFPLILTGPSGSADYFKRIDQFVVNALGSEVRRLYEVIINDPAAVARRMKERLEEVRQYRRAKSDAYYFNWLLKIDPDFQQPFVSTHANMANLALHMNQEPHRLAAHLRRAFSGIVAGNVKEQGIVAIERHGPFQLSGDARLMALLDELLTSFVAEGRMKLPGTTYVPCYELVA
jgi:predicted Rossmann-fold nucleotide-binding protein